MQAPDDLAAVEEGRGHAERAVRALDRHQLAVAEQLLDPALGEPEPVGNFGNGQPVTDDGVGLGVDLCHVWRVSHKKPAAKPARTGASTG